MSLVEHALGEGRGSTRLYMLCICMGGGDVTSYGAIAYARHENYMICVLLCEKRVDARARVCISFVDSERKRDLPGELLIYCESSMESVDARG